jgi:hypothetical protein
MKNKKIFFFFIVALGICATSTHALNIPFLPSPVTRAYNTALAKEDEEIRQEIFALLDVKISKTEWEEYKKQVAQVDAQEIEKGVCTTVQASPALPLSADMQQITSRLLKEHNASATKVVHIDDPKDSNPACACGTATSNPHILVNERGFDYGASRTS